MNSILWNGKMRIENQKKLNSEKTWVNAQKPRLKMPFKNSISREAAHLPLSSVATRTLGRRTAGRLAYNF